MTTELTEMELCKSSQFKPGSKKYFVMTTQIKYPQIAVSKHKFLERNFTLQSQVFYKSTKQLNM